MKPNYSYRKEKDPNAHDRILAIHMAHMADNIRIFLN